MKKILIVAGVSLLAGCGGSDAPDAVVDNGDGNVEQVETSNSPQADEAGAKLFYEYTLFPGSEYMHGIGPELMGGEGSSNTYSASATPTEVNDHYEKQSREQGFVIEDRSMLGEDDWLTVRDSDGRLILQSVAEPEANGSSYSLGFKLYPDE